MSTEFEKNQPQPNPYQPDQSQADQLRAQPDLNAYPSQPPQSYQPAKRLVRSRSDRMLGGVCGGLAQYLNVDATLIRLGVVIGTLLGVGSLALVYW